MHPSISLVDGVLANSQHPKTFEVPSAEEKMLIQPGDHVKVGFMMETGPFAGRSERMWVRISHVDATSYKGKLDNDPVIVPMHAGEEVVFNARHILSILHN